MLDALNAYRGDNIWEDVIYRHPDYDEARTAEVEHGEGNYVVTRAGVVFRFEPRDHEWREA